MIRFLQTPSLTKKLVFGAILTFICVAMVITLIPGITVSDYFGAGPTQAGIYATVGDEQVTSAEIQKRAQDQARRQGVPAQFMSFLMPQIAEQIVTQKAMLVEARRLGLTVSDDELRDELRNGLFSQQLYPKGEWIGQDKYDAFTQQMGYSIADFERAMKDDILLRKLDSMVRAGAAVGEDDLQKEFVRENTQVKFDYAVVTPESVVKGINPSEAELRKFYEASLAGLKDSIPEQRKVKYVLVDSAKLAAQIKPTPEDLQRFYNDHREQFRVEDEVNVSHILVKTPAPGADGKVDAKAQEAARAKAEGILKQVKGGADFAALAKKESDDPGTAANGGSLGWIKRGQTVAPFEQAAFSLGKGQVSDLVQSQFGFHIIKVEDKHSAHLQTLEEVKDRLAPAVAQEKADRVVEDTANKVLGAARSQSLDAAAAKNGLNVVTTDFFTDKATLPGLGNAADFMDAVFNTKEKSPPALARVEQGYVVFQLEGVQPPQTPTFEQARARLADQYKQQRAAMLLQQKTQELADRAHVLHNLKQAAKEVGAELKTSELVGPNSQVPEIGQISNLEGLFDMKPGEISGPQRAGNNGVVVAMVERDEPPASEFAAKRDQIREAVLQQKRSQAFGVFALGLRQRMEKDGKIKYNEAEKQRLTKPTQGS